MNAKIIEYVNPETGEVLKGTNKEIASQLRISEAALIKRRSRTIQDLPEDLPVIQDLPPKVTVEDLPVVNFEDLPQDLPSDPKLTSRFTSSVTLKGDNTIKDPVKEIITPKVTVESIPTKQAPKSAPIILPSGPCVLCGQVVFHRKDNQYQCLTACTPKVIKPDMTKISSGTSKAFKQAKALLT